MLDVILMPVSDNLAITSLSTSSGDSCKAASSFVMTSSTASNIAGSVPMPAATPRCFCCGMSRRQARKECLLQLLRYESSPSTERVLATAVQFVSQVSKDLSSRSF